MLIISYSTLPISADLAFGLTILCAVGVAINMYFLFHAIRAVAKKTLPYRRYLLSTNLAIGDILMPSVSCGIAAVFSLTESIPDLPKMSLHTALFVVPLGFSFLVFIVYSALNAFKLIAIKFPIFYKTRLTARHCHVINCFSWIPDLKGSISCVCTPLYGEMG